MHEQPFSNELDQAPANVAAADRRGRFFAANASNAPVGAFSGASISVRKQNLERCTPEARRRSAAPIEDSDLIGKNLNLLTSKS